MFLSGPYLQGLRTHEKFKWLRKAWQFQYVGCQVNLWVCIIGWLLFLWKDETAEPRRIGIYHFQYTEIDIFRVWIETEAEKHLCSSSEVRRVKYCTPEYTFHMQGSNYPKISGLYGNWRGVQSDTLPQGVSSRILATENRCRQNVFCGTEEIKAFLFPASVLALKWKWMWYKAMAQLVTLLLCMGYQPYENPKSLQESALAEILDARCCFQRSLHKERSPVLTTVPNWHAGGVRISLLLTANLSGQI